MTRIAAGSAILLAAVFAWASGCRDGTAPRPAARPSSDSIPGLIVSQPVPLLEAASAARAPGAVTATGVAYVSLSPGSVPAGLQAAIRSPASGQTVTVPVVNGGFDPVGVPANVGDTVTVDITRSGGAGTLHDAEPVHANTPPVVVRTDPAPKKVDVPLNAVMVVVFSEPIDSATLTAGAIQLHRDTMPVAGQIESRDTALVSWSLVPALPLAPGTLYRLDVSTQARGTNGDTLVARVTVEFTTAEVTTAGDTAAPSGLLMPPEGAHLVQNDPSIGCAQNPTRGRGFRLTFTWSSSATNPDSTQYRLYVKHDGSQYPVIDTTVPDTSFAQDYCNAFVIDANLTGWWWTVSAVTTDGSTTLVGGPRYFSFLPCRLDDGEACSAPAPSPGARIAEANGMRER